MKIKKEMRGDIAILRVSGDILGGPPASDLLPNEIKKIIEEGTRKVVVDIENVKHMNSTGLGLLIRGYTSLKNQDGELKLSGLNDSIRGILVMTKLESVFDTYKTLEGAVRNF